MQVYFLCTVANCKKRTKEGSKVIQPKVPISAVEQPPKSPAAKNFLKAFLVGGGICLLGQDLFFLYQALGLDTRLSMTAVTVTLIFLSALLTALGKFDTIAKFAGAGTLVPVTGFANAVVSPAIDSKSEGLVLGVGAKVFSVAGPVLLYSTLLGSLYGLIYFVYTLFGG